MRYAKYVCDECNQEQPGDPPIEIRGNVHNFKKGGILLPRRQFDFCSTECAAKWLANAQAQK